MSLIPAHWNESDDLINTGPLPIERLRRVISISPCKLIGIVCLNEKIVEAGGTVDSRDEKKYAFSAAGTRKHESLQQIDLSAEAHRADMSSITEYVRHVR